LVSVGGTHNAVLPQQVLNVVATTFNVDPTSMVISLAALEDFLLRLPDGATIDRVFNGGSPMHGPSFSLFFKRWTGLAQEEATALPSFVEVELHGVPAHAWEISTAQLLLGSSC
jgi:hypothetical protein